jgi:hypothetical protein
MLDAHLKTGAAVLNSQLPLSQRLRAAAHAAGFYLVWYPKQWLPLRERLQAGGGDTPLAGHLRYAARTSRRLARAIFHALLRHGPKLEREQLLLGRFVDIGTELFAMTAACLRAEQMMRAGEQVMEQEHWLELADCFCYAARRRISMSFRGIQRPGDRKNYRLARNLLAGKLSGLTTGIVRPPA